MNLKNIIDWEDFQTSLMLRKLNLTCECQCRGEEEYTPNESINLRTLWKLSFFQAFLYSRIDDVELKPISHYRMPFGPKSIAEELHNLRQDEAFNNNIEQIVQQFNTECASAEEPWRTFWFQILSVIGWRVETDLKLTPELKADALGINSLQRIDISLALAGRPQEPIVLVEVDPSPYRAGRDHKDFSKLFTLMCVAALRRAAFYKNDMEALKNIYVTGMLINKDRVEFIKLHSIAVVETLFPNDSVLDIPVGVNFVASDYPESWSVQLFQSPVVTRETWGFNIRETEEPRVNGVTTLPVVNTSWNVDIPDSYFGPDTLETRILRKRNAIVDNGPVDGDSVNMECLAMISLVLKDAVKEFSMPGNIPPSLPK